MLVRLLAAACAAAATLACAAQAGPLTLKDARARTLAAHPALLAAQSRVDAAKARGAETGRLANPVLSAEVENFGANASRLETTVRIAQAIELGGDRSSRAGVARAQVGALEAEAGAERRAVLAWTDDLFLDAWALQERLGAFARAETIAADAVRAADARHRAGAALASERLRAEAELTLRTLERARAEADFARGRLLLASQWGAPESDVGVLDPGDTQDAPADDDPRRIRARAELALDQARVAEARAARTPDLGLEFGARHLRETGATGFVAGVALPLPLWNARQGELGAAEADVAAGRARVDAADRAVRAERLAAQARYDAVRAARDRALPLGDNAREALDQVRAAHLAGRLGYADLLEAQRAVREAELAQIEARIELTRARVALERFAPEDR